MSTIRILLNGVPEDLSVMAAVLRVVIEANHYHAEDVPEFCEPG